MTNFLKTLFSGAAFFFPFLALAQTGGTGTLEEILITATDVVTWFVPTSLILLLFFWAMWQVISNAGDAEKLKKARSKIVWGIIILFVLFSLAGILAIMQQTFFGETTQQESPFTGGGSGAPAPPGSGTPGANTPVPALGCARYLNPDGYCKSRGTGDPFLYCNRSTGACERRSTIEST